MLKKLLKYDLKNIFKFLIIFYSLALTFGLLTRIFFDIENSLIFNIIGQIFNGAAISMMFSILINNLMRLWVRFKNNFYGDESYLTHTLPVEKKTLYLSKVITAVITCFVSVLAVGSTLFIAYYSKENFEMLKSFLLPIADAFELNLTAIIFAFLFIFFLEFANILQCGYAGIILGYRMNSAKIGYSVLFGYIAFMASQVFVLIVLFIIALFNKDFMNLFITNEIVSVDALKTAIYASITIYTIIFITVCYVNIKLFEKGVNVD